jgi:hypothetical protein
MKIDMKGHAAVASYHTPYMLHFKLSLLKKSSSAALREENGGAEKHAQAQLNPPTQKKREILVLFVSNDVSKIECSKGTIRNSTHKQENMAPPLTIKKITCC